MPDSTAGATATRIEGRDLVIERTFDAPRSLVFKAFTEPERLVNWFGPRGWGLTIVEADLRPGGTMRYRMFEEAGTQESWGKTTYLALVDPERIEYSDMFADADGNQVPNTPVMHVTITFTEVDGRTHLNMVTEFESVAALESSVGMGMVQGWTETLDRLSEYLAANS
jgi:uncharacterized protein YndB with AHSA1/START domain